MMRALATHIFISLACGAAACAGLTASTDVYADADQDASTDADEGDDADSASDGDTDSDANGDSDGDADHEVESGPITFRLHFISDIPESVWVDVTEPSWTGGGHWLTILRDDEPVRKAHDCAFCPCDECTGCGVCGAPLPAVEELATGGTVEWVWDRAEHLIEDCSGPGSTPCLAPSTAPDGAYVARFCWGLAVEGTPPGPAEVRDVHCGETAFELPAAGGVVEHTVDHGG